MNTLNENLINYYNSERLLLENIDSYHAEDYLIEAISNLIDLNDYQSTALLESIDFRFTEYIPLIEAVDELKETQKQIKEIKKTKDPDKKETLIKKLINQFNRVIEWWYKVEPNKKFATLHLVLKVGVNAITLLTQFIVSAKLGVVITNKLGDHFEGRLSRPNDKLINVGNTALKMIVALLISKVISYIWKLDHMVYVNINKKDIDTNIKVFEKSIKEYDKMIDKCKDPDTEKELKKVRNKSANGLAELNKIKIELQNKNI